MLSGRPSPRASFRRSARRAWPAAPRRTMREGVRAEASGLWLEGLLERTLAATGYSAILAADDSQESEDRLENLAELLSAAAEFEARQEGATLADFLDQVSLLSDTDTVRGDGSVALMTLHSAKGLEFDSVFLVGLEEGLVPHSRSLTGSGDEALEEERRLCSVGLTRAMEHLHLSWAQSQLVFGQRRVAQPSRFLEEIPREAVVLTGQPAARPSPPRRSPAWA